MTPTGVKSFLFGAALLFIGAGTASRLYNRWLEERADKRLVVMVDWPEVRDAAVRQGMTDQQILDRLVTAGANALLISPSTVQDYLWQDTTFVSRPLAEAIRKQLED